MCIRSQGLQPAQVLSFALARSCQEGGFVGLYRCFFFFQPVFDSQISLVLGQNPAQLMPFQVCMFV